MKRVGNIVEFLNSEDGGKAFANTIASVGDHILTFVENLVQGRDIMGGIQFMFDAVAGIIKFMVN